MLGESDPERSHPIPPPTPSYLLSTTRIYNSIKRRKLFKSKPALILSRQTSTYIYVPHVWYLVKTTKQCVLQSYIGKKKRKKRGDRGGRGFLAMMSDWMGGWKYIKILLQRGRVCMQIKRTEPGFLLDGVSVELDWDT